MSHNPPRPASEVMRETQEAQSKARVAGQSPKIAENLLSRVDQLERTVAVLEENVNRLIKKVAALDKGHEQNP